MLTAMRSPSRAMEETTETTATPLRGHSPRLDASVVYCRPALRAPLLGSLAELGVFVSEVALTAGATTVSPGFYIEPDLLIMVCGDAPEDLRLIANLYRPGLPVLIALLPPGTDQSPLMEAGIFACCDGEGSRESLLSVLIPAAARARFERQARPRETPLLFGDVVFQREPVALIRGGRAINLSKSEGSVLAMLIAARGEPVEIVRLGQQGDRVLTVANLKTIVMRIRRKVAHLGGDPTTLSSVRGFGYVLRS